MARLRELTEDPRWPGFCARYRYDFELAARELFDLEFTEQQKAVARDIVHDGARVAAASGHGTGKSSSGAVFMLTSMLTRAGSRGVIAGPKLQTCREGVFKYLSTYWRRLEKNPRHRWITTYFTLTGARIYNRRNRGWAVLMRTAPKGQAENFSGEHAEDLFWCIDEASGIEDEAAKIIAASCTEPKNKILMLSQGTRTAGYFYQAFTTLCRVVRGGLLKPDRTANPDGVYTCHHLSSIDSPLVSPAFIREKLLEYGGATAPHFQIKILGLFAELSDLMLLTRGECEAAQRHVVRMKKGWSWVCLADVGNGRDACAFVVGRVSGSVHDNTLRFSPVHVKRYTGAFNNAREFAYILHREIDERFPNCQINIDGHGVGAVTADILENDLGHSNVTRITWGLPCFSKEQQRNYINQRAWAAVFVRNMIQTGRMRLCPGEQIVSEFSRIPTLLDERGRTKIESKENMRKNGIPSPDLADCFAFLPLAEFQPPANDDDHHTAATRDSLLAMLNDDEGDNAA